MSTIEKINTYFHKSVLGIDERLLLDGEAWYSYVANLGTKEQIVYTALVFHQQVMNGGLHQYFYNQYGQFGYLTLQHLKAIGEDRAAEILQLALEMANPEKLSEVEFRKIIFARQHQGIADMDQQLGDQLDVLDNKYYDLNDSLVGHLVTYLEADAQ
jgi:hypothetical protein